MGHTARWETTILEMIESNAFLLPVLFSLLWVNKKMNCFQINLLQFFPTKNNCWARISDSCNEFWLDCPHNIHYYSSECPSRLQNVKNAISNYPMSSKLMNMYGSMIVYLPSSSYLVPPATHLKGDFKCEMCVSSTNTSDWSLLDSFDSYGVRRRCIRSEYSE